MAGQLFPPFGAVTGRVTPAAFPFYTTGEDNLRLVSYNGATGVGLQVVARTIDASGHPTPNVWPHTPNTDRTAASSDMPLSGTTLLNARVIVSSGTPKNGETYVELQMIRGIGPAAIVLGTVLAGYVTATSALGWPGSPIANSLEGPGANKTYLVTPQAPGVNWAYDVPSNTRQELLAIAALLSTDATVAARVPRLVFDIAGNNVGEAIHPNSTPASSTTLYSWMQGMMQPSPLAVAGHSVTALPQRFLLSFGDHVLAAVTNLQAGDQWSSIFVCVREWLEP
ncbi:MAG TPA: hypothetical protein VJN96_09150 [Vicinamibacterales bacterium]|nr:hypothetical protein [Vicinamibacterales bacterium]